MSYNQNIIEQNTQSDSLFDLHVDGESHSLFMTIITWGKILAIIAFITPVFSLIQLMAGYGAGAGDYLLWAVVSALQIVLNVFLYRFATRTKESLEAINQVGFADGSDNLRIYFKMMGILLIIALSLFVLAIVFFVLSDYRRLFFY